MFRKSQEQLDAAFLEAVGKFETQKAKKWLEQGANPLAVDAAGNNAFHKLAMGNPEKSSDCRINHGDFVFTNWKAVDAPIDEFVCFLLSQTLNINAANKKGQTCLHLVAENGDNPLGLPIFFNRGAEPNTRDNSGATPMYYAVSADRVSMLQSAGGNVDVQDNAGQTPLHVAASQGNDRLADLYLASKPGLVAVRDHQGKYPWESAVAGSAGHHTLSRKLKGKLEAYNAKLQNSPAPVVEKKPVAVTQTQPMPSAENEGWSLPKPYQGQHVEELAGYRLTEIFNFRARTYMKIVHNLKTGGDVVIDKSFDEFHADRTLLLDACAVIKRMGGQADESLVHARVIDKGTPILS